LAVSEKQNTEHLSLDGNPLGDEGVRAIVDALSVRRDGKYSISILSLKRVVMDCSACAMVIRAAIACARSCKRDKVKVCLTAPTDRLTSSYGAQEFQEAVRSAAAHQTLHLKFV
jgi:hypothetical protein